MECLLKMYNDQECSVMFQQLALPNIAGDFKSVESYLFLTQNPAVLLLTIKRALKNLERNIRSFVLSFVGQSLGDVPARLGPRYFTLVNWTRRLRNAKDHAFDCGRSVTGLYPELETPVERNRRYSLVRGMIEFL
jgi:hypothetical protein